VLVEDPLFCCPGVPSSPSGIILLHLHSFLSCCHDVFLGSVSFVYHLLKCIMLVDSVLVLARMNLGRVAITLQLSSLLIKCLCASVHIPEYC
jgi:hypothetical protein